MKVAQYAQIERSIAAAETTSIRDRWLFPAYPDDPSEPPADWRTVSERRRDRQRKITEGFIKVDEKRTEYLEALSAAVGDDWSVSWQSAHRAAFGDEPPGDES